MIMMMVMLMVLMMRRKENGVDDSSGCDDSRHARDYRDYTLGERCLHLVTITEEQWRRRSRMALDFKLLIV